MAGELAQSEVTAENFPLHFAIAEKFGGSVHAFDVYQGPYIRIPASAQNLPQESAHRSHKLWLGSAEGTEEGWCVIYNETLDKSSHPFWPFWKDDAHAEREAIEAAEDALTPRDPAKKKYKVEISVRIPHYATVTVEAETAEEALALAKDYDGPFKWSADWTEGADFTYYEPKQAEIEPTT